MEPCRRSRGPASASSTPPVDQPWQWREARLRDPDGNRLCLFHAGENRLNPPWRLGNASIGRKP